MHRDANRAYRLLSVDWDFFVPLPQSQPEFGDHPFWKFFELDSENAWTTITDAIWMYRVASWDAMGVARPGLVSLDGFWDRFSFAPDAQVYYADSNKYARDPTVGWGDVRDVWSFDAHHDLGYGDLWAPVQSDEASCEDWLLHYALDPATVHVRYPLWRMSIPETKPSWPRVDLDFDASALPHLVFDRVFLCRSGGWTPPYLDEAFLQFVADCPVTAPRQVGPLRQRTWDESTIEATAADLRQLWAKFTQGVPS